MSAPMFTIKAEVEGAVRDFPYRTLDQFFSDTGLRSLCDDGLIESCAVHQNGRPLSAPLPKMLISWERLRDQVISNSSAILRSHFETIDQEAGRDGKLKPFTRIPVGSVTVSKSTFEAMQADAEREREEIKKL